MASTKKRTAEVERVAMLLQRANNRNRLKRHQLFPTAWVDEFECVKDSYRAMARAVVADQKRRSGLAQPGDGAPGGGRG
jgi:hypothetical protein